MSTILNIKVIESQGIIDEVATEADFVAQLRTLARNRSAHLEEIAGAVAAVFDRHPGSRVNLPHLASMALASLNVAPEAYAKLESLCLEYIRSNCQGSKGGDSVERPASLLVMGKGREGGVSRRADLRAA
jgi:hypothetical protein